MARAEVVADERVRQERAYQLKLMGMRTWQEIADSPHPEDPTRKLYSDGSAASAGFRAALKRHAGVAETEALRDEWTARHDLVFRTLLPQCLKVGKGQLRAIEVYTKLFAEHAKMLGLNMPAAQHPGADGARAALLGMAEGLRAIAATGMPDMPAGPVESADPAA